MGGGMVPDAFTTHQIEGRVRIQVPSRRRDSAFFEHAAKVLRELEGVEYVYANPLTASMLLVHDLTLDQIGEHARRNALFNLTTPQVAGATLIQQVAAGLRAADRHTHLSTNGAFDLESLIFVGLTTVGVVQIARQNVWPSAFSLIWFAFVLANKR